MLGATELTRIGLYSWPFHTDLCVFVPCRFEEQLRDSLTQCVEKFGKYQSESFLIQLPALLRPLGSQRALDFCVEHTGMAAL